MPIPENEVWRLGVVTEMKKVINNEWNNSGLSYDKLYIFLNMHV
tara:strand:- start:108 stop:239 length:132 start_codon:yes stop_codon:yes gene_type:complete